MRWLKNLWRRIVRTVRGWRAPEAAQTFVADTLREIVPPVLQMVQNLVAQRIVGTVVRIAIAVVMQVKWLRSLLGRRDVWESAVSMIAGQLN